MNWQFWTVFSTLILALMAEVGCGVNGMPGTSESTGINSTACSPNVIDSGLQLEVKPLSTYSNTYSVRLCTQSQPGDSVYSLYAGFESSDVSAKSMSLLASERLTHISGTNTAGAVFQVTFAGSDTYFAIYQDKFDGSNYALDNTKMLVSPHRIPGR